MSFLKRMFGAASADDYLRRGDELLVSGDFGGAKLEYDRALGKCKDKDKRESVAEKIDTCLDGLARIRLQEAQRLVGQGDLELARSELDGALEIVAGDDARSEVQRAIDELERDDAVEQAAVETEMTPEEHYTLISGNWEDARAEEYEELGEDFVHAILALHGGKAKEAHELFEEILDAAEAPRYLWLEVARARLMVDDDDGGKAALLEFLDSLADDEVGEACLAAHVELARIADADDDFEGAMAQYQAAVEKFEQDHRPYLAMGLFLRSKELPDEAIDVLKLAAGVMDDLRPDWRVMQELGLAYRDADKHAEAIDWLEQVISFLTDRKFIDFPVTTAVPLAELHEEHGKKERAADLYAALTRGSDAENHAQYHADAGRVLAELGLKDEARRMYKRANALTEDNEELRGEIEAALDAMQ